MAKLPVPVEFWLCDLTSAGIQIQRNPHQPRHVGSQLRELQEPAVRYQKVVSDHLIHGVLGHAELLAEPVARVLKAYLVPQIVVEVRTAVRLQLDRPDGLTGVYTKGAKVLVPPRRNDAIVLLQRADSRDMCVYRLGYIGRCLAEQLTLLSKPAARR